MKKGGVLTDKSGALENLTNLIKNGLNPGTTADFTASSIMVAYLNSYNDYKNKL
jgi:triphosphoribosyl-dephospho-CoA synthase